MRTIYAIYLNTKTIIMQKRTDRSKVFEELLEPHLPVIQVNLEEITDIAKLLSVIHDT